MKTETSASLRLTRVIKTDPNTAFAAWTQPRHIKRWSCPEGHTVVDSQVDLRVGGAYRLQMRSDDGTVHTARGIYREIDAPHRLVYTWDWEEAEHQVGETVVTIEFRALGGDTEIVLTHELFPAEEAKEAHEVGWTSCLDRLEVAVEAGL